MRTVAPILGTLLALGLWTSTAALAGEVICSDAEPTCVEGSFCSYPDGTCDDPNREGTCQPFPDGCGLVRDPVCGCDGATYGNRCLAHAAGVSIAHPGACGMRACSPDEPCPAGDFCKYADDSCFFAFDGRCTPYPDTCLDEDAPVCGCDGVTYRNACVADAAGVSIRRAVPCDVVCDGPDELSCNRGEFCLHSMQTGCRSTDSSGECVPVPDDCPGACRTVCGCDGLSYGSSCEAVAAQVQPVRFSECDEVRFVAFPSATGMRWNTVLGVSTYHVYRLVRDQHDAPPSHSGVCLDIVDSASATVIDGVPEAGRAWWLQVAALYDGVEGPLGLASDCTRREPLASCEQASLSKASPPGLPRRH